VLKVTQYYNDFYEKQNIKYFFIQIEMLLFLCLIGAPAFGNLGNKYVGEN
jgi:hypothetical protein